MTPRLSARPLATGILLASVSLAVTPPALAQPATPVNPQHSLPTAQEVAGRIRVPIHTAPSAYGIAYGTWAAGPN